MDKIEHYFKSVVIFSDKTVRTVWINLRDTPRTWRERRVKSVGQ